MRDKLNAFAAVLEAAQLEGLKRNGTDCEANREHVKVAVHIGRKFARVDIGTSGRYMVDLATGEIVGVKAYGVPHYGHRFGTVDTIGDWDWSDYRAERKG